MVLLNPKLVIVVENEGVTEPPGRGSESPCSAWEEPESTTAATSHNLPSVQEGPLQMACVGYALKVQNNNLLFFNIQIQILFFLLFLQRYSFV